MRLVGDVSAPRLVTTRTNQDHTDRMLKWAQRRVVELENDGLCGFIFKRNAPSSGMESVRVYNKKGMPVKKGVRIYARVLMKHFPLLPVEDERRLHDPKLRENFLERIFVFKRWRELIARPKRRGHLVDFHTKHKLLVLSHSENYHREMGRLVAKAKELTESNLYKKYQRLLMEALRLKTTIRKNVNVLMHVMGYFKKQLSPDEKQELLEVMDSYRQGHVPPIVPITLVNHYVRKYDQPYLKQQYYLHRHPIELQLRNHV
jgi:uncharacterized protein YbgA (DUF1722 family)